MDSKIWGSYAWYFIHLLTYNMPTDMNEFNKYMQYYKDFFNSLLVLLPCPKCRTHYKSYLMKKPIAEYCVNKNKSIQWMIDLHNDVNKRLAKYGIKRKIYTRTEVDNMYLDKSGNININHQKLAVFPNIILNTLLNKDTNIQQCKIFLSSLSHIHPCKLCSIILADEIKIFNIDNLKIKNDFIDFSNKLIPLLRTGHSEGSLIPTFTIFNRKFVLNKDNNTWDSIVFDTNIKLYRICNRNNTWELCIVYKNNPNNPYKTLFINKKESINPPLHETSWERQ